MDNLHEIGLDCSDGDIWAVDGIEPGAYGEYEPPPGHPDVIEGSVGVADEPDQETLRMLTAELEKDGAEALDDEAALALWVSIFGDGANASAAASVSTPSPAVFDNVREVKYTDVADEVSPQTGTTMNLTQTTQSTNGSSSSSSTTTSEPKALDRSHIEGLLSAVAAARLTVDSQARKTTDDPLDQAKLVKRLNDEYHEQEKTLQSILNRIEKAEDDGLEEKDAHNYGLFTVDANYALSQRLDEVVRDCQRKMDDARDEAAAAIRACEAELAENGSPEVYSIEVRDRIYAELVRQGVLAPYAPMEI